MLLFMNNVENYKRITIEVMIVEKKYMEIHTIIILLIILW